MKEKSEGLEIDIKRMFMVLLSNAWIILLVGILLGSRGYGYARVTMEPTYSATAKMYVNNNYPDSYGVYSSQLEGSKSLAETYMVILESREMLQLVVDHTNLGYSVPTLKSMITASAVNNTEIFQIRVVSRDAEHSAIIANAVIDIFPTYLPKIIDVASVKVVERAVVNHYPVGPSYANYGILGAFLGCFLAAGVVVVAELLDTTINSEEYLAQVYKSYPLLAVVPGAQSSKSGYKGYYKGYYASSGKTKRADPGQAAEAAKKPEKKAENKNGGAK